MNTNIKWFPRVKYSPSVGPILKRLYLHGVYMPSGNYIDLSSELYAFIYRIKYANIIQGVVDILCKLKRFFWWNWRVTEKKCLWRVCSSCLQKVCHLPNFAHRISIFNVKYSLFLLFLPFSSQFSAFLFVLSLFLAWFFFLRLFGCAFINHSGFVLFCLSHLHRKTYTLILMYAPR